MPKNAEKICSATVGKILRLERRFFPTVAWEIRFIRFFRPLPATSCTFVLILPLCLNHTSSPPPLFCVASGQLWTTPPNFLDDFLLPGWLTIWQSLLLHQLQDYPPTHFRFFCIIYSYSFATSTSPHYCTSYFILPPSPPAPASSTPYPLALPAPHFRIFESIYGFFYAHVHSILYTMYIHH